MKIAQPASQARAKNIGRAQTRPAPESPSAGKPARSVPSQPESAPLAAFRANRAVGDALRGRILERESPQRVRVELDGHVLTATAPPDAPEGAEALFRIERLAPDVALSLVRQNPAAAEAEAAWGDFLGARAAFENAMADLTDDLKKIASPEERRKEFIRRLKKDRKLAGLFGRVSRDIQRVNAATAADDDDGGGGDPGFTSLPWLFPGAKDQEARVKVHRDKPGKDAPGDAGCFWELALSFRLEQLGGVEMRVFCRPPAVTYRLFLERPEEVGRLDAYLKQWRFAEAPELAGGPAPACIGVDPLPPGGPSLMARVLDELDARGAGLNLRA